MIVKKDKFKNIFSGLTIAYGQYQPGERGENGKQQGKAFIVRKPVTDELWENHLTGKGRPWESSLLRRTMIVGGGVLILTNITLIILASLKVLGPNNFPLIVCRSKSGGAHVFLFTKENIPASLMQSKLKQFAKVLGYEGSEIFPKQTEILVDRGDTGNFLNLPYHNEMKGLRYAINDNGSGCTLEEFYQLYDVYSARKKPLKKLRRKKKR